MRSATHPRPARTPARRGRAPEAGYALLVVLLLFSLLAIGLAAAAPAWTTALKREREQAEIDYARQYVMGIRRYYHKFGTYPPDLDRLEETNDVHYLRRAWPDPLSKNGKWRFLHTGDVETPMSRAEAAQIAGGLGGGSPFPGGGGPGGAAPSGGLAPLSPSQLATGSLSGAGLVGGLATPNAGAPPAAAGGLGLPTLNFGGPNGALPPLDGDVVGYFVLTPAAADRTADEEVIGSPIIGVASYNNQPAVHAFQGQSKPSDWLFVYDPQADRGGLAGAMPVQGQPLQGLGGLGQNSGSGGLNPSPTGPTPSPGQPTPQPPIATPSGGSPFGPG